MATGISKYEQQTTDALSAFIPLRDPLLLPSDDERVELHYAGKAEKNEILIRPNFSFKEITESGNGAKCIEAIKDKTFALTDNLFGLHDLYESGKKVTLFYLDPPYGTGMDYQSRELEHAYDDKMGTAKYTEFMRRRLVLMRECMADDGSIYVHIGHQMLAHLKLVMDEIFGQKNFCNLIVRRKCSSKNFTRNQYANLNDYILFYSKSSHYKWFQPGQTPDQSWVEKEYPKVDKYGRRFKLVPIHAPGTRKGETGEPWRGKLPPPGKHWQYTPSKLDAFDSLGDIHWSRNDNPRRKVYWNSRKKVALTDYWDMYRDAHHQSIKITGYPTEKNLGMLKMIIEAGSEPEDLVVDPFCGSGTAMQAARDLGRSWIGFDASFVAAKATLRRMKHGAEPMGDYVNARRKNHVSRTDDLFQHTCYGSSDLHFVVDSWLLDTYEDEIRELSVI